MEGPATEMCNSRGRSSLWVRFVSACRVNFCGSARTGYSSSTLCRFRLGTCDSAALGPRRLLAGRTDRYRR